MTIFARFYHILTIYDSSSLNGQMTIICLTYVKDGNEIIPIGFQGHP